MTETYLLQYSGSKTANINMKNCKALLKKVVIGRAVTALKQQKSKGKGQEKGIAEIVHLMKPITRSPVNGQTAAIYERFRNPKKNLAL
jgi:hypothetical protein